MLLHGTCSYVWCSIVRVFCFWGCLCWQHCRIRNSRYCWCWVYRSTLVCGVLNTGALGVWAVRILKAQILRVLGVWWVGQNPDYNKQYPQYKHPKWLEYSEGVEPVDISSARSIYSRNTASTLSTRNPPPELICFNSHSWDNPWTVNAVCNKMRMTLSTRRCTDRWSEYTSYSQYTALIESILVLLRVLAVLAVPVVAVTTGRNSASTWHYPQYRSLKYLKYSSIPQSIVQ